MYSDRLEIINPGGLYGAVTTDNLGTLGVSSTRNQFLSRLLEITPYPGESRQYVVENRGTGYLEILDQLQRNNMAAPKVDNSLTHFMLTVYRGAEHQRVGVTRQRSSSQDLIIDYVKTKGSVSTKELSEVMDLSVNGVRRILSHMVNEDILVRTEPLKSPKQRYRLK